MRRTSVTLVFLVASLSVFAKDKDRKPGKFSGGLETSWGFYFDDPAIGLKSDRKSGTNTYVNLGYEISGFRFGVQYDIYEKPMLGYDPLLEGNNLGGIFAGWSDSKWDITLGTFKEQYGSGLLFRAYEQRDMGINTSVLGASAAWRPLPWMSARVMAGSPRRFMDLLNRSYVYGADMEVSLLEPLMPESASMLTVAGSWVMRDDRTKGRNEAAPARSDSFSGRLAFSRGWLSIDGEYVHKGKSLAIDPRLTKPFLVQDGQALLLNMNVSLPGFGMALSWRSIENMAWHQDDSHEQSVNLNYIPALTKQHKYALFALYPHKVNDFGGETGGQADISGSIPVGGNRRRPLKYSFNASAYFDMPWSGNGYKFMDMGGDLLWAEAYLELEKKWGPDWKTIIACGWQRKPEFSRMGYGEVMMNTVSQVADVLWQTSRKVSLRMELQHVWSDFTDDKGWVMGLLELGIAPGFMVYASDMCNYSTAAPSNTHYYDFGLSYVWKSLRSSISYGRHRAGETCSGGICRYVPEYTGMNLNITITL